MVYIWFSLISPGCSFGRFYKIFGDFRIYGEIISINHQVSEIFEQDRERIKEKIRRSGIEILHGQVEPVYRLSYKINVVRHIIYILHKMIIIWSVKCIE